MMRPSGLTSPASSFQMPLSGDHNEADSEPQDESEQVATSEIGVEIRDEENRSVDSRVTGEEVVNLWNTLSIV